MRLAKNDSIGALSQQLPLRLKLSVTPWPAAARYSALVYWQPRSECTNRPGPGRPFVTARAVNAASADAPNAQPTTRRDAKSRTAAR